MTRTASLPKPHDEPRRPPLRLVPPPSAPKKPTYEEHVCWDPYPEGFDHLGGPSRWYLGTPFEDADAREPGVRR